jgi:signal peptidase I
VDDRKWPLVSCRFSVGSGEANVSARKASQDKQKVEPGKAAPAPAPRSALREYGEALVIAVLLALVIRTFVVQAFKIPSGSMLPTLQIGDHILVNKFIYYFEPIRRGDIIVFKFPQDETRDFVKRAIGLPGETLEIRGRQVLIDGVPLKEPYAVYSEGPSLRGLESEHLGPLVIPPGKLFMMGDNRDHSMDSRAWGFMDVHEIRGTAFIVYFSIRIREIPCSSGLPRDESGDCVERLDGDNPYLSPLYSLYSILYGVSYVVTHPATLRWGRIGMLLH